ncbi:MAG: hypothetical protein R3320_04880 [Nitriliruptorales bacterium]|nr:hypothetical protein [Nitriliruptorales bacterium]
MTVAVTGVAGVIGVMLLVVMLDLAAYLAAASGAQSAADAAALAAVVVSDPRGRQHGSPVAAATAAATNVGARLERCGCEPGSRRVEVEVSVPVRAVLITQFAARRVTARAEARLVPP